MTKTPSPATLTSLEKAITGTLRPPRDRRHRAHVLGEQRPEDQAVAVGERLVGGGGGAAGGVVGGDPDPLAAGVEQGEVGGIEDRLAEAGIGAAQRHQHRDPVAGLVRRQARRPRDRLGLAASGCGRRRLPGASAGRSRRWRPKQGEAGQPEQPKRRLDRLGVLAGEATAMP